MSSATVAHNVPGRIRVRVQGSRAERSRALDALQHLLDDRYDVTIDARTGSALIRYEPADIEPDALIRLLREADDAFGMLQVPELLNAVDRSTSAVAETLSARLSRANRSVLHATQGHVDLRVLLPVTLGGLALRQLARQGPSVRGAPWYVLAYYAFDSYIKLHADGARGVRR
jgi:hypothetical protein